MEGWETRAEYLTQAVRGYPKPRRVAAGSAMVVTLAATGFDVPSN